MASFSREWPYQHDLKRVVAFYRHPDSMVQKFIALGARKVKLGNEILKGSVASREIWRELPANPPKVVSRFFQSWNQVMQKETWDLNEDSPTCEVDIKIKGVPVEMKSFLTFHGDGQCCLFKVSTSVLCAIPLIGKHLENFIIKDATNYIEREFQCVEKMLMEFS